MVIPSPSGSPDPQPSLPCNAHGFPRNPARLIVLRDGSRVEIDRRRGTPPTDLAREIGDFLGVPVEREWITGRPLLG